MAAPSRRVVDITTRRPLGLSVPDDRREDIDDEPENDKPEVVVRPDNCVAWLSDIDFLINFDRKRSSKRTFKVMGEALGEIIAEIIAETQKRPASGVWLHA